MKNYGYNESLNNNDNESVDSKTQENINNFNINNSEFYELEQWIAKKTLDFTEWRYKNNNNSSKNGQNNMSPLIKKNIGCA